MDLGACVFKRRPAKASNQITLPLTLSSHPSEYVGVAMVSWQDAVCSCAAAPD